MAIKFTRVVRNSLRPWIYESQCRGVQGFTCCNEWAPAKKANNCSGIEFIVNKISRLASLKEIDKCKGELCGKTEIVNRYGKLISSSCNQEHWTRFEKSSIGTHFCFYVLNKLGLLERAARISCIILTFAYRLILHKDASFWFFCENPGKTTIYKFLTMLIVLSGEKRLMGLIFTYLSPFMWPKFDFVK